MKTFKKLLLLLLLVQLAYYGYIIYKKGYKYDANDPDNSLAIMIKLTDPLERQNFIKKFDSVCRDYRCSNLHGMTKKDIYQLYDKIHQ